LLFDVSENNPPLPEWWPRPWRSTVQKLTGLSEKRLSNDTMHWLRAVGGLFFWR